MADGAKTFADALDELIEEFLEDEHREDIIAALDLKLTEMTAEDAAE